MTRTTIPVGLGGFSSGWMRADRPAAPDKVIQDGPTADFVRPEDRPPKPRSRTDQFAIEATAATRAAHEAALAPRRYRPPDQKAPDGHSD